MLKMKLLVAILIVILVASIAFNAYQWNTNLSLTNQSKKEAMAALLIQDASNINSEATKTGWSHLKCMQAIISHRFNWRRS